MIIIILWLILLIVLIYCIDSFVCLFLFVIAPGIVFGGIIIWSFIDDWLFLRKHPEAKESRRKLKETNRLNAQRHA